MTTTTENTATELDDQVEPIALTVRLDGRQAQQLTELKLRTGITGTADLVRFALTELARRLVALDGV